MVFQQILRHARRHQTVLEYTVKGAVLVGSASVTTFVLAETFKTHNDCFKSITPTSVALMEEQQQQQSTHPDAKAQIMETMPTSSSDDRLFYGQCLERQVYKPQLPYPAWHYNWDGREPTQTTKVSSDEESNNHKDDDRLPPQSTPTVGKTRHILLIRHGQYVEQASNDEHRVLTPLGRRQAQYTGQRLARMLASHAHHMRPHGDAVADTAETTGVHHQYYPNETDQWAGPCRIRAIHTSTMTRARETAAIIGQHVQQSEQEHYHRQTVVVTEPDPLLSEGLPAPIIPPRPDVGPVLALAQQIDNHHDRLEAAFQKYIHRADHASTVGRESPPPPQLEDSSGVHEFEVIVGHANVIRYFFCRALQLPPEAWLRLSLFNCSVTYLMVQPNGYVTARLLGDTGHIPYEETTFSGAYGYNWKSPTST